jgi:hypothetical protein
VESGGGRRKPGRIYKVVNMEETGVVAMNYNSLCPFP